MFESPSWSYSGGKDYLIFNVNNDIKLHGVCLFGSVNNEYRVELVIKDLIRCNVKTVTGSFRSQQMECNLGIYFGFEIVFDTPLDVKKNTDYLIEATISGPQSGNGYNGLSVVDVSGVKFTFKKSAQNRNRTSPSGGQFPRFLFSL